MTGVIVAKLDGTAKGGIVFAVAQELGLPVRFIGTGETLDDLAEFDAEALWKGCSNKTARVLWSHGALWRKQRWKN